MTIILAIICVAIWAYLLAARGQFWRGPVRDAPVRRRPQHWPSVAAVIPARNEAECIGESVQSLLRQDYPASFRIIVVDDDSSDGTADVARAAAAKTGRALTVLAGKGPPAGWTGKLWALKQGIAAAEAVRPDYLLLTDADIVHAPDSLTSLVAQSLSGRFVLTSLMAKLRCKSLAERLHVPAFIYFFQMLYPFSWVCRTDRRTAAAAGGCMLVRADALESAGGIASIRNALIDDCSLAAKLKTVGPIWLGLTERVRSIRPYPTFADVRQMISRSAYAQLRYSPLRLAGTIAGMALTFLAAPLLGLFASGVAQYLGLAVWLAMAASFVPTLRFYRLSPFWGLALPAIAILYLLYTLDSAYRHWRRRGGQWKGRVHVNAASLQ
ncbi:MAG TPA: glycosyltransferase [Pseudolabrys sp.]|nr:glycosyltransferase [Pseudolabrys sp.]